MLYLLNYKKYAEKSPSQLWEDDHKTFYYWIASFIASLLIIIGLYVTMLVFYGVDKDVIVTKIIETNRKPIDYNSASTSFNLQLAQECIKSLFIFIALVLLIKSFIKGIKVKSFAIISFWPTLLMFILSVYSIIGLIFLPIFSYGDINAIKEQWTWSNAYIISFTLNFVYIVVYFLVSRNVSQIRIIFTRSQIIEASKAYRNFSGQNPMDMFNQQKNPEFQNMNNQAAAFDKGNDPLYLRLNALDKKQLGEIAKQLSISGYDSMTKDELIRIVYAIYKSFENEKNEYEIKTEKEEQQTNSIDNQQDDSQKIK